jgi:Sulfotransferase family
LSERRAPIFVGGAAHSGMSAVSRLLDAHPRLVALPAAARFHCDEGGMPALLAGQVALDDFLDRLRGGWWNGDGGKPGLEGVVDRSLLEHELARFREDYHRDPLSACRELFLSLMEPVTGGGRALVDTSPANLRQAQALVRIFPEACFVHVVRDGRDVASAAPQGQGLAAGLRAWAAKLREIEAAMRADEDGSSYAIPADAVALVVLDELVAGRRETSYEALLASLGLDDDPGPRAVLGHLGPGDVAWGRWRERARGPSAWALRRRYRRALEELEREGNRAGRPLIEAYERLG